MSFFQVCLSKCCPSTSLFFHPSLIVSQSELGWWGWWRGCTRWHFSPERHWWAAKSSMLTGWHVPSWDPGCQPEPIWPLWCPGAGLGGTIYPAWGCACRHGISPDKGKEHRTHYFEGWDMMLLANSQCLMCLQAGAWLVPRECSGSVSWCGGKSVMHLWVGRRSVLPTGGSYYEMPFGVQRDHAFLMWK